MARTTAPPDRRPRSRIRPCLRRGLCCSGPEISRKRGPTTCPEPAPAPRHQGKEQPRLQRRGQGQWQCSGKPGQGVGLSMLLEVWPGGCPGGRRCTRSQGTGQHPCRQSPSTPQPSPRPGALEPRPSAAAASCPLPDATPGALWEFQAQKVKGLHFRHPARGF